MTFQEACAAIQTKYAEIEAFNKTLVEEINAEMKMSGIEVILISNSTRGGGTLIWDDCQIEFIKKEWRDRELEDDEEYSLNTFEVDGLLDTIDAQQKRIEQLEKVVDAAKKHRECHGDGLTPGRILEALEALKEGEA